MDSCKIIVLGLAGALIYYIYKNPVDVETAAQSAASDLEAATMGWQQAGSGPTWLPILSAAEVNYNLPQNLLARQAYQESSFIENVIRGIKASSAGALGIMQLMPQFYSEVQVPVPFTDADVSAQISRAASVMAANYQSTGSWSLALAAYNAGLGNVEKYSGIPPFAETQKYVSAILSDVPAAA